jgi:hypothetical protein
MEAMEHDWNIAKEIKWCIEQDRTRVGDDEGSARLAHYMKMSAQLWEDASQIMVEVRKSKNKWKRASKHGLHDFTNKKRKTKKRKNLINGWSVEGKQYVCEMIGKITQDEQSRICKKWEAVY